MRKISAALIALLMALPLSSGAAAPPAAEWPLRIEGARAPIVIYQPQPESLKGNLLKARAAVSVQPAGKNPVFGAVWLDARIETDREKRTVTVENVHVTRTRFKEAKPEQEQLLSQILSDELNRRK